LSSAPDDRPGIIIVWSYSMILPPPVLEVPPRGAVNVHGGPLPEYRGGHVAQWAIINGERDFGVTLHYLDEGIDTGPIIEARRFPLEDSDDAHSVRRKIQETGSDLLRRWWRVSPTAPACASGRLAGVAAEAAEGRITWTMTAREIWRLVRALS
jgi:methionyl-tRNA formyltransferase